MNSYPLLLGMYGQLTGMKALLKWEYQGTKLRVDSCQQTAGNPLISAVSCSLSLILSVSWNSLSFSFLCTKTPLFLSTQYIKSSDFLKRGDATWGKYSSARVACSLFVEANFSKSAERSSVLVEELKLHPTSTPQATKTTSAVQTRADVTFLELPSPPSGGGAIGQHLALCISGYWWTEVGYQFISVSTVVKHRWTLEFLQIHMYA